jgi:hypothetical protein
METFRYPFLTVCSMPTQAAIPVAVGGKLWTRPVMHVRCVVFRHDRRICRRRETRFWRATPVGPERFPFP